MVRPPETDSCSICHCEFNIPCQANCSHWFCGDCILQVWLHGSALQSCKCPLCRRSITLLIPTEVPSWQQHDPHVNETLQKIERYNHIYGERVNFLQKLHDLPFLLKRLLCDVMSPQTSLPLVIRARVCIAMILSVFYILSPVDIIPEGILGAVGILDDLIIVLICCLHLAAVYRSVLLFRHGGS